MEEQEHQPAQDRTKPDGLLYHYTNQNGLLGILGSKTIWATHIRYLNDSSEYTHGLEIVRREVLQLKVDPSPELAAQGLSEHAEMLEKILRKGMTQALESLDDVSIYVASFFDSSDDEGQDSGDMLGQWRAYSGGSAGFSIGFDKEAVAQYIWRSGDEDGIPIMGDKCVYQLNRQQEYVHKEVAKIGPTAIKYFKSVMSDFMSNNFPRILEEAKRGILRDSADQLLRTAVEKVTTELQKAFAREAAGFSSSMASQFARIAVPAIFMKNPAFSDEREWRIAKLYNEVPSEIMFRAGKSSLIPFITIPLPQSCEDGTSLIRRIVVGPSPKIDDAVAAVRMLLKSLNFKVRAHGETEGVEIVPSKIPYRDW